MSAVIGSIDEMALRVKSEDGYLKVSTPMGEELKFIHKVEVISEPNGLNRITIEGFCKIIK